MNWLEVVLGFGLGFCLYVYSEFKRGKEVKALKDDIQKHRQEIFNRDITILRKHYMDVPIEELLADGEYVSKSRSNEDE